MSEVAEKPEVVRITLKVISDVEQFYFREARLFDDRKYQQWLGLITEDISYTMPVRHSAAVDPAKRDTEELYNVEQELSSGIEPPHRDDNYLTLMIRATRPSKINSWSDNPTARTRRFVTNVEVLPGDEAGSYTVYSNVIISYSRFDYDNHLYTAQRKDVLRVVDGEFRIARREIIIDWNVVTAPSLGIFF